MDIKQSIELHITAFTAMVLASLPDLPPDQISHTLSEQKAGDKIQTTIEFRLSLTGEQEQAFQASRAFDHTCPEESLLSAVLSWMHCTSRLYSSDHEQFLWMSLTIGNRTWSSPGFMTRSPISRFYPQTKFREKRKGGLILPRLGPGGIPIRHR